MNNRIGLTLSNELIMEVIDDPTKTVIAKTLTIVNLFNRSHKYLREHSIYMGSESTV